MNESQKHNDEQKKSEVKENIHVNLYEFLKHVKLISGDRSEDAVTLRSSD